MKGRILYFDCPSGISGDMCVAALIDLGADFDKIKAGLGKLGLHGYTLGVSRERRHGITGTRFKVKTRGHGHERKFSDIKKLIEKSTLSRGVKDLGIRIFENLAMAEARVHGVDRDDVHFHEVGAVDSIVDIVGAALAMDMLRVDGIYSSAVALGSGLVSSSHGMLPVPAPATVELLRGVPVRQGETEAELTTPTGAAILKTVCKGFGPLPAMTLKGVGYGIGSRDFKEAPNVLRVMTGEAEGPGERVVMLEANMDDSNPQVMGYLMDRLFERGALDVFFTPVQMKKSRPGVMLTALVRAQDEDNLMGVIFRESSTIGVRRSVVERHCLERRQMKVKTPYGQVRVKVSSLKGRVYNIQPEYEDCRVVAQKKDIALKDVMDMAKTCAMKQGPKV